MSVPTLWGQTDKEIDIKYFLNFFQDHKEEVIQQTQKDSIQDKDTVLITSVINDAVYLYNNYKNIATKDSTLSSNIKEELTNFCTTYFNNITKKQGQTKVFSISTLSYFKTIQSYQKSFQSLREQVKSILEAPRDEEVLRDSIETSTEESYQASKKQDSIPLYILIILGVVGATSIIFAILALKKINKTDKEIQELKTKINKIEEAAASSKSQKNKAQNQTASTPATAKTEPVYPPQPPVQNNNVAVTPPPVPEKKENISKAPQETYLYANANANGGIEFYKVTPENSGDKVFIIILKNADDENGDFTIAPMSDNFMRDAITDRNTYLPPLFCESTLDSSNPTRIEVKAKGKAKKVGGKWQMQERMKIRLI